MTVRACERDDCPEIGPGRDGDEIIACTTCKGLVLRSQRTTILDPGDDR